MKSVVLLVNKKAQDKKQRSCKVGPKFTQSWPEVHAKLAQSLCTVGPKFAQSFAAKFALEMQSYYSACNVIYITKLI